MKIKNNKLRCALVGLLTITLFGGSVRAAAANQLGVVLVAKAGGALSLYAFAFYAGKGLQELLSWFASTDENYLEKAMQLSKEMVQSSESMAIESVFDEKIVQGGMSLMEGVGFDTLKLAIEGSTEQLRVLLKAGADVHSVDRFGMTALMLAALQGDWVTVQLLLDAGARVSDTDRDGRTALACAAQNNHYHIVTMLQNAETMKK